VDTVQPPGLVRRLARKPITWVVVVALVIAAGVGLYLFQPWKIFTSSTIDEALPSGAVTSSAPAVPGTPTSMAPASPDSMAPAPGSMAPSPQPSPAGPVVLAEGTFVTQEHQTSGTAKVIRLADGSRVLRLENLSGSDGPDLHVWLTDQEAGGDWFKYDDARVVPLGKLKATHGNQNYAIPAAVQLGGLRSVVIWCDRFNVAFGSAPLPLPIRVIS
jgi:hypothetical protein